MSGEVTELGHDSVFVTSVDDLFAGTPDTFFVKYLLAKTASCKDCGIVVIDISVAFMHALTDEEERVKKAEPTCLRPEHREETHFLKHRICKDDSEWHVEMDQRYVRSLLDAMGMN